MEDVALSCGARDEVDEVVRTVARMELLRPRRAPLGGLLDDPKAAQ
jgi:hypothetical protein